MPFRSLCVRAAQCLCLAAWLALGCAAPITAQDNRSIHVLTRHNDNARTGQYLNETALNAVNVNAGQFGLLSSLPVNGEIYAQPLYVSNLAIAGGIHDVVFVATAHNDIYAYDATGQNLTPYWRVNLGPPIPAAVIGTLNLPVEVGIISTPALDITSGAMYVCCKDYVNGVQRFHLHALDLATGADKQPAVEIAAKAPGSGAGGDTDNSGNVVFQAEKHNQRSAVTLANGNIYLAFAAYGDYPPYHGWVLSYNAATLTQNGVHCNTPNGGGAGIWMSGEGLAVDNSGSLYYVGGNGAYSGATNATGQWDGASSLGESVVKLNSDASVADWFTPQNYDYLNSIDFDLSSSGAMLVPGPTASGQLLLAGGKEGKLYVIDPASLTKYNVGNDAVYQEWQATGGHIHSSMAYWNGPGGPTLYVWGESDKLKSFKFANGYFQTTPTQTSAMTVYPGYANGPGMAISANGSANGILWSSLPYDGDAGGQHVGGILRAFDAADVSKELWNSKMNSSDDTGVWAKWTPPVIVKGRVYQATFSNKLLIYGLTPKIPPAAPMNLTATAGNGLIALNWTAAPHASAYNVWRSLVRGGPYAPIASHVAVTSFRDTAVSSGVTYYYVASALNAYGESGFSNEDNDVAGAPAVGTAFGFQFAGVAAAMTAGESAGVIPVMNWNSAAGSSGTITQALDCLGAASGVSVTYSAAGTGTLGLPDAPGAIRLMNGYLEASDLSTIAVSVTGLPASFVNNGYDVYVYCAGDNAAGAGIYTAGDATIQAQDNGLFDGTLVPANNSAGNYILFSGQTGSDFSLTAAPDPAVANSRVFVNALQIVARLAAPPAFFGLTAAAGDTAATLNWTASGGAVTYKVKRAFSPDGPYTTIANGIVSFDYTDVGLTNGKTYYYLVTAENGDGLGVDSNKAAATPLNPDFSLSIDPGAMALQPGTSGAATVLTLPIGGFSSDVTLAVSGLPPGIAGALTSATLSPGGQSLLALTADPTAPFGRALVTVSAVSGSVSHSATFTLYVAAPANAGNGIFGINFQGGVTGQPNDTPLGPAEIAGVIPIPNWNNAPGSSGTLIALRDSSGAATAVAATWSANATGDSGISDTGGDFRLMKGCLDASVNTATAVTFSGLDPTMTYDFYLYANGDSSGQEGVYTLNGQSVYIADNALFSGTYVRAAGTAPTDPGALGNYAVLRVSGSAAYTLTAAPEQSVNGSRAPLNAAEIVAVGRTVSGTITLEGATNPAQMVTFVFRDFATGTPLFTRTQILTPLAATSGGTFQFTGIPAAKYTLAIKGSVNLQKVVPVLATASDVTNVAAMLPAGDANNDNSVDSTDFGLLIGAFNTDASISGGGYDPRADFNYDGFVDSTDFGLLIGNFNLVGDN